MEVMARYRSGPYELELIRDECPSEPYWSFIGEWTENKHTRYTFRELFGEGGSYVVFAVWHNVGGAITWETWRRGEQPQGGSSWHPRPPDRLWIATTANVLREFPGHTRRSAIARARRCMAEELAVWESYYRGDVFGWRVAGPDVEDSCYGYYGETELPYMRECAADAAGVPAESWILVHE